MKNIFPIENVEIPYSEIAEKMVLSAILLDNRIIYLVSQKLNIEAFYLKKNQNIYRTCLELYNQGKVIDVVTVVNLLKNKNLFDDCGGNDYISEILEQIINIESLDEYCSLIQEKYLRRLIIEFGFNVINSGYLNDLSLETIFNEIEQKLYTITNKKNDNNLTSLQEILSNALSDIKNKTKNYSLLGLSSSYYQLDNFLQGFQKSDLIIIAGRPSMGKTSFSLNLASNIAKITDKSILFFSLEMSKQQLIYRFLSTESGINSNLLRSGRFLDEDWTKLNKGIENLLNLKIYFDDNPSLSITNLRFKIKKFLLEQKELGLVIIDYLQLIQHSKKNDNRVQELSYITRNLKIIAKEFDIPIIVLSQLSRSVEARVNKRPILSDLRESGCIYTNSFTQQIKNEELNSLKLKTWDNNNLYKTKVKNLRLSGKKPVYKVCLNYGHELFVSGNHKFFSNGKWCSLKSLRPNDKILIQLSQSKKLVSDKIIKIEYVGLKNVFDLTIPKTKNYIFNGVLNHNSIEQDADVVIMIYREEYYENEDKDNREPSLVEFIVAKHRNGPTGSFKLKYYPNITKFVNIKS